MTALETLNDELAQTKQAISVMGEAADEMAARFRAEIDALKASLANVVTNEQIKASVAQLDEMQAGLADHAQRLKSAGSTPATPA